MGDVRFTHIGGPTTLIEVGGWRLLTDPTFDPPGRRYYFGWGGSSRKVTGPAILPDEIGDIDAVLLTHDHHADNLDNAGRALLPRARAIVTTASGAGRLGGAARGLLPWQSTRLEAPGRPTIEVTATPCRHGPPGSHFIVGDVIGFSLRWEGQQHGTFWITGDTVLYDGVREVAERVDVGTAIVHVGRVRFTVTGPISYTLNARDAISLCELVAPVTAVPIHYEGWSHFTEARAAIEAQLRSAPVADRERFKWVPIGEAVALTV